MGVDSVGVDGFVWVLMDLCGCWCVGVDSVGVDGVGVGGFRGEGGNGSLIGSGGGNDVKEVSKG